METGENGKRRYVVIKNYKLKDLADIYRISKYFMRALIYKHRKKIGRREGHYYQTEQVAMIFELIKLPSDTTVV
jgi:hypothetical protein